MKYQQILFEVRDRVALITMNRPEKLNAWTPRMSEEEADALARANADPEIGAIVLTGAGRGFCAGADMAGLDWVTLVRESKPLVAAVNGASVGIGLTRILPFDLILASQKARFGMLFIKMGLVPELASTHFLVQRMGFGKASEMCLSGRLYSAAEAQAAGLVDRVVEPDELLDEALAVANEIASNPSPQLRMTKALLTANGSDTDLRAVQKRESELLRECWETPEHAEAVRAFGEKRPPKFR